jgi:adenylosuccinate synthase
VYEVLPGWSEELDGVRDEADLPPAAAAYVDRLQRLAGVPITLLSVGAERTQTIIRSEAAGGRAASSGSVLTAGVRQGRAA